MRLRIALAAACLTHFAFSQAPTSGIMQPVLTRAYDNNRSGANTKETVLTAANVKAQGIRKYFGLPLEGDARGAEAQPLILPSVPMPDGNKRDVLIQASMNNLVFAFDANDSDILWTQKLGVPIKGGPSIDMHGINDHWGILPTGVIDPDAYLTYQLAWTSPDGTPQKGVWNLYTLDIRTGQLVGSPVQFSGLTYQPTGGTLQHFNSTMRKCRSSLAFVNNGGVKTVFGACGTVLETESGAAGIVWAYDVASGSLSMTTLTAGDGAGMWMGGQGLVARVENGVVYLYGVTGNGSFNGVDNFAESAVKIKYIPPTQGNWKTIDVPLSQCGHDATNCRETFRPILVQASLAVVDHWTPYTDEGRIGGDVTGQAQMAKAANKLSGISLPTEEVKGNHISTVEHISNLPDMGCIGACDKDDGMPKLKNCHSPAPDKNGIVIAIAICEPDNDDGMPVNGMVRPDLSDSRTVMSGNVPLLYPKANNNAAFSDEDLGSAQGAFVSQYNVFLVAGKDGIGYPVNAANMGQTRPDDFLNAKANYAKLAASAVWLTEDPGPVDPMPQDPTTLNFMPWSKTRHMHSTPVQYMSPTKGMVIFAWGENSALHAWGMAPNGTLTYLAQSNEVASPNSVNSPGGMPGGFCTLSSNNNALGTAVLWCTVPYGDANATVTNGRLIAYDPENFVNGVIPVLWDSQAQAVPFMFNKFLPPIVDGGKLFVPNYSGGVDVYGLAN